MVWAAIMHKCPHINVLTVATHKCQNWTWCGGENWTNGKFGKLKQWKIYLSHYVLLSAERSSCRNVLSLWTSSYLNVESEPRMNHVRFGSDIYVWLQLKHLCVDIYVWWQPIQSIFMKWSPFFNFFIMADTDIPFLLTLGKPEAQSLVGGGQ